MSKKKKEWRAEKERVLSLGQEERRKEFGRHYMALDEILTWSQQMNSTAEEEKKFPVSLCDKVSLHKGDITILEVDAIVNAANSSLLGGGGVDGCIHRAAGHFLYEECHSLNGCDTGKAKITCGYDLPAKYVIHTVGPIARGNVGSSQREDLKSCYENSLKLVKDNKLRSVAFPCISTGIYGFPNEPAADIALKTVRDWLKENKDEVDCVIFCVFLETDYEIYKRKMSEYFSPDKEECVEDDGKKEAPVAVSEDVEMESQSQGAGENDNANEEYNEGIATEESDPEVDKKPEGEHKPEEEKENLEKKKKGESEDSAERENSGDEKAATAPADREKEQAESLGTNEEERQEGVEPMAIDDQDEAKNTTEGANENDINSDKVENCQDVNPQEPNQGPQTDNSQSKDGLSDVSEPTKE